MLLRSAAAALCLCAWVNCVYAQQAVSQGGQPIQLNEDGSWTAADPNRYALTADGRRVRLEANGQWRFVDPSAPGEAAAAVVPSPGPPQTADSTDLSLTKVEILRREVKRGKTTHVQTRTLFHVQVINRSDSPFRLDVERQALAAGFVARTSRGAVFPIIDIHGCEQPLHRGEACALLVTAKDSPVWGGSQSLLLQVFPNTLGNPQAATLSQPMARAQRKTVDRF